MLTLTAQKVLEKLNYEDDTELSITLVKDATIKKMNKKYRGKNYPTDVLSFSTAPDFPVVTNYLGDIFIGVNTAKRNASLYGISFEDELVTLLVHGILHLSGYDHEDTSDQEAEKMMRKQRELLLEVLS
ncbi:MAG: rRNA maturation RNase YbeY [Proteobacteria bacterium]|nr:rRNA maturation RNase YbeY [Pseudomonadota bacterium]